MNGIRIRFETKPGKSFASAGTLPRSRASATIAAAVSSDVCSARITSTSWSTGTGLKKCMPITRSGRAVAAASAVIGIDDVLEARIARAGSTASAARNSSSFAADVLDDRLDHQVGGGELDALGDAGEHVRRGSPPFASSFSRLFAHRRRGRARPRRGTDRGAAPRRPEAATTWAMPAPIWPAPTTRTRSKLIAGD